MGWRAWRQLGGSGATCSTWYRSESVREATQIPDVTGSEDGMGWGNDALE